LGGKINLLPFRCPAHSSIHVEQHDHGVAVDQPPAEDHLHAPLTHGGQRPPDDLAWPAGRVSGKQQMVEGHRQEVYKHTVSQGRRKSKTTWAGAHIPGWAGVINPGRPAHGKKAGRQAGARKEGG